MKYLPHLASALRELGMYGFQLRAVYGQVATFERKMPKGKRRKWVSLWTMNGRVQINQLMPNGSVRSRFVADHATLRRLLSHWWR